LLCAKCFLRAASFGIVLAAVAALAASQTAVDNAKDLDVLLANKKYPELEAALLTRAGEMTPEALAYFSGVMSNRLNQSDSSLALLEPVLRSLVNDRTRTEIALCTLADDYAKNFRYRNAARIYADAGRFARERNVASTCDANREASRWALLSDFPVQTITWDGTLTVTAKWDDLGLIQVPVSAGGYAGSWILDSGASLSVISQSVARQIGVNVSSASTTAEGGAGAAVPVHVGIIPELHLGSAILRNVPVLVAADPDLDFPSINYRIEGCLGLPVLTALGEVTIQHDGTVRFGADADNPNAGVHDLFLEKFVPVITADFGLGDQLFTIDTGAVGTVLSSTFYHEGMPLDSAEPIQLELLGAGGRLQSLAYQIHNVGVLFGGSCATLETIQVLTKSSGSAAEFYGNIGEDALKSFTSFTLDFIGMRFAVNADERQCENAQ
jgi:predicted aspartyl protease